MKFNCSVTNGLCSLYLHGEFDADGAQSSRSELEALCLRDDLKALTVNMQHVPFLDSSGVGALVYLFKRMAVKSVPMSVEGLHGQPEELMRLLRMDQAMSIKRTDQRNNDTDNLSGVIA